MPQTSSSFIGGPLTETPTSDEMTTNNAHSSMPPITSAFSTDPDMRSDTTSTKNIPPLTTPTTGTSEDQNSEKTMTTNAHITMLTSSSHVITRTRTSAFSTDPGTIFHTTSKNMPPLTTPATGTSEDQNSDTTRTTNAHITILATPSSVITRYTEPYVASRSTTTSSIASRNKGFQEKAGGNSNGLTIGGAIGGIVIFVIIIGTVLVLIAFMLHRRKKSKSTKFEGVDNIIYNNNEGT